MLTYEEEVYFARRALRGDEAAVTAIESNLRLVVKLPVVTIIVVIALLDLVEEAIYLGS